LNCVLVLTLGPIAFEALNSNWQCKSNVNMFHSSLRHCVVHQTNLPLLTYIESHLQCLYDYFCPSWDIWSLPNWKRSWKLRAIKYYPTSKLDGHIWSTLWNMCLSITLSFYGCIYIGTTKSNFSHFYENIIRVEYYHATLKYNAFFD
jgi:hypothetical protein